MGVVQDRCGGTWGRSSRSREETREQAKTFTAGRRDTWKRYRGSRGEGRQDVEMLRLEWWLNGEGTNLPGRW